MLPPIYSPPPISKSYLSPLLNAVVIVVFPVKEPPKTTSSPLILNPLDALISKTPAFEDKPSPAMDGSIFNPDGETASPELASKSIVNTPFDAVIPLPLTTLSSILNSPPDNSKPVPAV